MDKKKLKIQQGAVTFKVVYDVTYENKWAIAVIKAGGYDGYSEVLTCDWSPPTAFDDIDKQEMTLIEKELIKRTKEFMKRVIKVS